MGGGREGGGRDWRIVEDRQHVVAVEDSKHIPAKISMQV
jgi:hypothetical protein